MQVLLRMHNNEEYVWKDATYTNDGFIVDGQPINETSVVSVKDDDRATHFRCSVCGQLFHNDDEEGWQKHITPVTDNSKCFDCQHLRTYAHFTQNRQFSKGEREGLYTQTLTQQVELSCGQSYYRKSIDSNEARRDCPFNRCKNATKVQFSDIFTQYPGVFDHIITTDRIAEVGYKSVKRNYQGSAFLLKGKYAIEANANDLGIIDHFTTYFRSRNWTIYYSHAANKLFEANYSNGKYTYSEWDPSYVSQEYKAYVLKKIASLYKEGK